MQSNKEAVGKFQAENETLSSKLEEMQLKQQVQTLEPKLRKALLLAFQVYEYDLEQMLFTSPTMNVNQLSKTLSDTLPMISTREELESLAIFILAKGNPNVKKDKLKSDSSSVLEYLDEVFEGCKRYGDLEYDVFKRYFLANSIKEEREGILADLNRLIKQGDVQPSQIVSALKKNGQHLDNGIWIEDFVIFALKHSNSLTTISSDALDIMKSDFEVMYTTQQRHSIVSNTSVRPSMFQNVDDDDDDLPDRSVKFSAPANPNLSKFAKPKVSETSTPQRQKTVYQVLTNKRQSETKVKSVKDTIKDPEQQAEVYKYIQKKK